MRDPLRKPVPTFRDHALAFVRDLFRKPVSTFRDHALAYVRDLFRKPVSTFSGSRTLVGVKTALNSLHATKTGPDVFPGLFLVPRPKARQRQERTQWPATIRRPRLIPLQRAMLRKKTRALRMQRAPWMRRALWGCEEHCGRNRQCGCSPSQGRGRRERGQFTFGISSRRGPKPVTQAYKDNWNLIFGEKKKKR